METYKRNPDFVTNFMHIDLEYYSDLLPDDILEEFKKIKRQKVTEMVEKTLKKRENFECNFRHRRPASWITGRKNR